MRGFLRFITFIILVIAITTLSYLGGYVTGALVRPAPPQGSASAAESDQDFRVFWEAWYIVQQRHYRAPVENAVLTYGAIRGAIDTLGDPYTWFADPVMAERIREDATGRYSGIGAVVNLDDAGHVVIVHPFAGGPAQEAGLTGGDVILEIEGQDTLGLSLEEAVSMIRGPEGTAVRLLVQREVLDEPFEAEIVRAEIEIPTVESRMLEDGIGYLKLNSFRSQAPAEVRSALTELLDEEPRGLILDLRDNPGGLLSASIEIASEFVAEGAIVLEKGSNGLDQEHMAQGDGVATDVPLVVLVNGGTASAAEIVAGAIRDHDRGVLIGARTLGKASVQSPIELSDGSHLRLTIAHWFTPNGQLIQEGGLAPHIEVALSNEDLAEGRDPQLDKAISYLLGR